MPHHYLPDEDQAILNTLFEKLGVQVRNLDHGSRDRVLLNLSARLCEMVAYDNATHWPPASVADLVHISAQIERKSVALDELE
ncbi:hypothetical protein [Palleronia sp. LCG004]|uniref:hypothetical protein n=1 Tax=Palleronia sp. LCG004 TaxID=3079304 RepID=UPI0029433E92|nr:hypothetical protein [Palleronia sp. LCG004]WOI55218.1 hypothetical protein RVY76_09130 [Palleronia sp. LCG004]